MGFNLAGLKFLQRHIRDVSIFLGLRIFVLFYFISLLSRVLFSSLSLFEPSQHLFLISEFEDG